LRHDLRSVTKSVIATLVAAAIQDGKISGEQKVLAFFPEHRENGPGQEALRVRHLLDMTTGIQWREWPYDEQSDGRQLWASPDWADFILARDGTGHEVPVRRRRAGAARCVTPRELSRDPRSRNAPDCRIHRQATAAGLILGQKQITRLSVGLIVGAAQPARLLHQRL
jgi:Beta-lactamase